ncbi:MAG: maleylpyruvate isomerase family mycothiol-dependent enzyme, partial [Acidimicrobiales bacterium]
LQAWRDARGALIAAFAAFDPAARLPWYGPPMGARSFLTARLMETWAHGQDVRHAVGLAPEGSNRLRHIAHLGVVTRSWSYRVRGMEPPEGEARVELVAPDGGEPWTWGPPDAPNRVRGTALEFCLVVTQRRHVDDTSLVTEGDAATEWMRIAQCFAGGPTLATPSRRR